MVPNETAAAQVKGVNEGYIQMFLMKYVCPKVQCRHPETPLPTHAHAPTDFVTPAQSVQAIQHGVAPPMPSCL